MNYLLDTHTFIWSVTDKKKLSVIVRETLEDNENNIFVSAITFWEITLKISIGKLELLGFLPQDLPEIALETGFQTIPLSPTESATYHQLEATWHKDPFDRMLIWQAMQQKLILVSKDDNVIKYRSAGLKTLW